MCFAVFLGTDLKLETIRWDEKSPSFYVEKVEGYREIGVKKQFTKTNSYYVGSDEGCGCGFSVEEDPDLMDDPEEVKDFERRRKNVSQFCSLLKKILSETKECEVFLCWEGDHDQLPKNKKEVKLDFFESGDWVEDQPTLYIVKN